MQVGKFPPISSSNPIGSPQLRLESKRQGAVNDGPHHLLPPRLSFPCFTTPPAPPSPISLSRAIGKTGPSAANDFDACCGAAMTSRLGRSGYFFFNDTATTEIYTLSLHAALPICSFAIFPRTS